MLKVSSSLVSQVNKAVDEEVRKKKSITKKGKEKLVKVCTTVQFSVLAVIRCLYISIKFEV